MAQRQRSISPSIIRQAPQQKKKGIGGLLGGLLSALIPGAGPYIAGLQFVEALVTGQDIAEPLAALTGMVGGEGDDDSGEAPKVDPTKQPGVAPEKDKKAPGDLPVDESLTGGARPGTTQDIQTQPLIPPGMGAEAQFGFPPPAYSQPYIPMPVTAQPYTQMPMMGGIPYGR